MYTQNSEEVYDYLNNTGIKHANLGYRYIYTAICMSIASPHKFGKINDLYVNIAEMYSTTSWNVERCIRHAILSSDNKNITNKEFITSAVDYISIKQSSVNNSKMSFHEVSAV
jgi:Sporulation initiation factor Spo0A C terminal.